MCVIATSVLLGLSQTVLADTEGLSKKYSICMDKSEGITSEMIDCGGIETHYQDTRLNKAYKDVMAALSPSRKKPLQNAQRLWIKYREANCNFYNDPDGGTNSELNSSSCFMQETLKRANELDDIKKMVDILG